MKFDTSVSKMFMFKRSAEIYADKARQKGYKAKVTFEGNNWYLLGGRWSVKLDKDI